MAKVLGADQVGMEIVLDEGTFSKDKDKLLESLKKPVVVPVDADTTEAEKKLTKAEQQQIERERKKAQREEEQARKKAEREAEAERKRVEREQREAESARKKAEAEAEATRKREDREAEAARKAEALAQAEQQREAERIRKESVSDLDKAFVARQQAELKKLASKADALIPVGIDGDKLRAELAAKVAAASAAIKADIPIEAEDASAFRAEVSTLVNEVESQVVNLQVDADAAKAAAKLAALQRDREINMTVDVDTARATAQLAAFRAAQAAASAAASASSAGGSGGGFGGLGGLFGSISNGGGGAGFGGITSTLGAAGPYGAAAAALIGMAQAMAQVVAQTAGLTLVGGAVGLIGSAAGSSATQLTSLTADVTKLAGAAALLPAVAIGVAGIAGAAAAALTGVPEALEASREAQKAVAAVNPEVSAIRERRAYESVTEAAKDSAKAQIDAIESVAAARKAAETANVNAVDSYLAASEAQDDAAKSLIKAQEDLNEAYRDSKRDLDDLELSVDRTSLNQQKAAKALKVAKDNLAEASTNSRLDPSQLKAYQDAVTEAELAQREAASKHARAQEDYAKADADGIQNSDRVVDAKERVAEATEAAADAEKRAAKLYAEIEQTRLDGEKRISDAKVDAQERVTDAQKRAKEAAEDYHIRGIEQAEKQAAAVKDVEDALKNISPSAREAVAAVSAAMDEFKAKVQLPSQEEFFDGFSSSFDAAADRLMPELESGLTRIADSLGDSTTGWMDELSKSLDDGVLDGILDNVNTGIDRANEGIAPLVEAFTTMGETGSEYLPRIGDGLAGIADKFNEFIQEADKNGDLDRWITGALDGVEDVGTIAANVVKAIDEISKAADNADSLSLDNIADGMEKLSEWLADPSTQETLTTLFEGGKLFFDNLGEALPGIADTLKENAPALKELAGTFGEIGSEVLEGIGKLFGDPAVVEGAQKFADGLLKGLEEVEPHIPAISEFLGEFMEFLGKFAEEGGEGLGKFIEDVAPLATDLMEGLTFVLPMLNDFLGFLDTISGKDPEAAGEAIANITSAAEKALGFLTGSFSTDWLGKWDELFNISPPDIAGDFSNWSSDLLSEVKLPFEDFDFNDFLYDRFTDLGSFWDDLGIDFENGFGGLIDDVIAMFGDGGKDALDAMLRELGALNPLNVFNNDGASSSAAQRSSSASGASAGAAGVGGRNYNIESVILQGQHTAEELFSGLFDYLEFGR